MITDIQYFAANYVSFKDNLTEDEKATSIKWLKEAPDEQIKSLLISGDYKFRQEFVDQFDNTLGVLLSEVLPVPYHSGDLGFKGLFSADQKVFTGVVDIDKLNSMVGDIIKKAQQSGQQAGQQAGVIAGIGAAAIAALVIVVAHRAYKRFLSKAARACNQYKGPSKTSCMIKFKREAMKKKIIDLNKGTASCKYAKDSMKCKHKIETKIRSLKIKLGEQHG